ncbi:MAG: hypothetical protein EXR47_02245 [Dehalococcoidia bacterium]|nr:hypothetical protein [Dehalococcoidia bacterium]
MNRLRWSFVWLAALVFALGVMGGACGSNDAPSQADVKAPAPSTVAPAAPSGADAAPASGRADGSVAAPAWQSTARLPVPPDLDLEALTEALRHVKVGETAPRAGLVASPPQAGQSEPFWLVDMDARKISSINATLKLVTLNAYWYVEDGVSVRDEDIQSAARAYEDVILPKVAQVFGPRSGPPLRGKLTVLHARLQGAAGYFSGNDGYPKAVHQYSNERLMLYMNTRAFRIGSRAYQAVLAHEFQHALHNDADPGEDTWVNEGLSEFSSEAAGFTTQLVDSYAERPGTPLSEWSLEPRQSAPHYGAANLFFRYLFEHYGSLDSVRALVEQPADSFDGVNAYLASGGYGRTFADVFKDWLVANLLARPGAGRYDYATPPSRVTVASTLKPGGKLDGEVAQFGADYVRFSADRGDVLLRFQGALQVSLLPTTAHSGASCWWGNRGDTVQPSMTHPLDLRGLNKATLQFWAWFDLEEDWDYAYAEVSIDGGHAWDIVHGAHASAGNPVGNSLGPGFTGKSGGWLQEEIDLTPYAGRNALLRFQYVTDEAINSHGLCLDDIAVPELGWSDNAETDGGWQADGFFRTDLVLPQLYAVQVVEFANDGQVSVRGMTLDATNAGSLRVEGFGTRLEDAVVIVAPMTPPTRVPARYTLEAEGGLSCQPHWSDRWLRRACSLR